MPPTKKLTTLGWLKHLQDPCFGWFEWHFLTLIQRTLTEDLLALMTGIDERALRIWWFVMQALELDRKACVDLMLLAHSGVPGRACANWILWELLSDWALRGDYEDLSNKVSSACLRSRKGFDRPPAGDWDLQWWRWSAYEEPPNSWRHWDPRRVPPGDIRVQPGPGGVPVRPPDCWVEDL